MNCNITTLIVFLIGLITGTVFGSSTSVIEKKDYKVITARIHKAEELCVNNGGVKLMSYNGSYVVCNNSAEFLGVKNENN